VGLAAICRGEIHGNSIDKKNSKSPVRDGRETKEVGKRCINESLNDA
jgi:hypothetical protein